jgi:hypothetical protein
MVHTEDLKGSKLEYVANCAQEVSIYWIEKWAIGWTPRRATGCCRKQVDLDKHLMSLERWHG